MKNIKTHEEWYAGVIQKGSYEDGDKCWWNVTMWDNSKKIGDRYYKTREEAERALNHAYRIWNGEKKYNSKGERYETTEAAPGIGVSVVCTKASDDRMRIVKHIIKKRIVTEWETVEKN